MCVGWLRSALHACSFFAYPPADPYTRMGGEAVPALAAGRYPDPAQHVRGYPAPTDPLANPGRHRGRKRVIRITSAQGGPPHSWWGALLGTVLPKEYLLRHFLSIKTSGAAVMTHRPAFC